MRETSPRPCGVLPCLGAPLSPQTAPQGAVKHQPGKQTVSCQHLVTSLRCSPLPASLPCRNLRDGALPKFTVHPQAPSRVFAGCRAAMFGALCTCWQHMARAHNSLSGPQPLTDPWSSLGGVECISWASALHEVCDPSTLPVPKELHAKLSWGVSWSNLLWRDVSHTLSLSTDGILKAPILSKPDGHSCPPWPIPWSRVQGCPGGSLLLQTWVGVGETMHHHSVSTITLLFLPWAGSCFFWKRCRQEISRGLC